MKELHKEDWSFILYEENDGSLLLDVVCGTVAIYNIKYRLKPQEIAAYKKEGILYIKTLASRIQGNPTQYQK